MLNLKPPRAGMETTVQLHLWFSLQTSRRRPQNTKARHKRRPQTMKARQAAWLRAGSCRALANVQPEDHASCALHCLLHN